MPLVGLIVVLMLVGFGLYLLSLAPIDATIKQIIYALLILIVILWLLSALGLFAAGPVIRFR